MKIVKEGFNFKNMTVKFECRFCGCTYLASQGEYIIMGIVTRYEDPDKKRYGFELECKCPNCGMLSDKETFLEGGSNYENR